ncbi:MAG: PKD domain-containing protein [Chitinophagales bacterium]|nr:PKD domain-containing protein [Chitinophagales bacterium]
MAINRFLPFIAFLYCFQLFAQPSADFTSSVVQGCSPVVVDFFDNSSGDPDKWKWDFGNGSISFIKNPSVSFNNPGLYTVVLIATDSLNQSDTIVKTAYIEVLPKPVAGIGVPAVNSGCVPFSIQLQNNTSGGSGTISTFLWDFGDGSVSSLENPLHTYNLIGNFSVSLQVIDSNGCIDFIALDDTITAYAIPKAEFSADTFGSCQPPLVVNFQNNSTPGSNLTYLWKLGDGATSIDKHPSHSYNAPGVYSITLIISDASGCVDSIKKVEYISVKEPEAFFTVNNDTGCLTPADTFVFFNQSNPFNTNNIWNFGDGSGSLFHSPVHSYNQPGSYDVSLIISAFGCSDTATRTIVFHEINADFSIDTNFACSRSHRFQFNDQSFNGLNYYWTFGDGGESDLSNPKHKFVSQGNFRIMLEVENAFGCIDTISKGVLIRGPVAFISPSLQGTCIPVNLTLRDSFTSSLPISSSVWDLGYTTISGVDSLNFLLDSVGVFSVGLIVVDSFGCSDTAQYSLLTGEEVTGNFLVLQDTICANKKVQFQMLADTFTEIFWSDGVNQIGTSMNNFASYLLDPGYWLPSAYIEYNGCLSQVFIANQGVEVLGMRGAMQASLNCFSYLDVFLDLNAVGAYTEYSVDPGFGALLDSLPATVSFPDSGKYLVILSMYDSVSGCISEDTTILELYPPPQAHFTVSDSIGCNRLENVMFDANSSSIVDTLLISSAMWIFGNGDTVVKTKDLSWKQFLVRDNVDYNAAGLYLPRLFVRDVNSCMSTFAKLIRVIEHNTAFGIDSGLLCAPTSISFADSSVADGQITNWIWTVDGMDTITSRNASFYFQNQGAYLIELQTSDTFGCSDSKSEILVMNNPQANIGTPSRDNCINDLVIFYNLSIGQQYTSFWEFGDGNTSTDKNPLHIYSARDSFTVKLTITDKKGCVDSVRKRKYIIVRDPQASFTVDPDSSLCPPLLVSFSNTSQGNIVNWNWNLGDGAFSSAVSPFHNYSTAGMFTVSLTVVDDIGCVDSVRIDDAVFIGGPTASYRVEPDSICRAGGVDFYIESKNNVSSVLWDFGDGIISGDDTVTHIYDSSGVYNPVLILDNGLAGAENCVVSIPLESVYVDPVKASFELSSTSLCNPSTISILDNSTNTVNSIWILNSLDTISTNTVAADSSGIYEFVFHVSSSLGCQDSVSRSIEIFENFQIEVTPLDTVLCRDETIQLTTTFNGDWSYNWVPSPGEGQDTVHNPIFQVMETEVYILLVEDHNGCSSTSDSIFIQVQSEVEVNAFGDTVISVGGVATIFAEANQEVAYYSWTPVEFLSCSDCNISQATPVNATSYIVQVEDTLGCGLALDTVRILLADNVKIELPDAFSPNNDEVNDVIYPKYRGVEQLLEFSVYNRYGERVFTTDNLKKGWDGRYEGNIQNLDTYFYVIKAESFLGIDILEKGSFLLIK